MTRNKIKSILNKVNFTFKDNYLFQGLATDFKNTNYNNLYLIVGKANKSY